MLIYLFSFDLKTIICVAPQQLIAQYLQTKCVRSLQSSSNNKKIYIRRIDRSFESTDDCMRINIELKTNLRAMENIDDKDNLVLMSGGHGAKKG